MPDGPLVGGLNCLAQFTENCRALWTHTATYWDMSVRLQLLLQRSCQIVCNMRKGSCWSIAIMALAAVVAGAGRSEPPAKCEVKDGHGLDVLYCLSMSTGRVAMAAEQPETLAASNADIPLGAEPVEVTLAPGPSSGASTLASRLATVGSDRRLYLILKRLHSDEPPESLYRIYLALPRTVAPTPNGLHYVGSFNFFNAGSVSASRFYSYDVTDLVKTLQTRNLLGEPLKVTIVPTAAPTATAKPFIGEIALVAQ
jgi:hypothetical protein